MRPIETAVVEFPITQIWLEFTIHLIDVNFPLLILLADMNLLCVRYDKLSNKLIHARSGEFTEITKSFGHHFFNGTVPINAILQK